MNNIIGNFIGGEFVSSSSKELIAVTNPANDKVIAKVPIALDVEIDCAVKAAKIAFNVWRRTPLSKRIECLSRLRDLIQANKKELAFTITREHGKTLKESLGELTRSLENMTFALNIDLMAARHLSNIASGDINIYSHRIPCGVFCAITPFNFPGMIPLWFLPYALLTGNTFILKPSEQTPLTSYKICELIQQAGFPAGVVNLVNGDKSTVEKLVSHPDIVGVSSVSSTPVMHLIADLASKHRKRYQCQGGAKNFVIVTSDVNIEIITPHIIESVFGNTGQRCLAGSNVVLVGPNKFYRDMVEAIYSTAKDIAVGEGTRDDVQMGPVISQKAKQRIVSYIQKGILEKANLILDGRNVVPKGDPNGYWLGPSIFTNVTSEMSIACDEIFGPVMTILQATNINEVIDWLNKNPYGNAAMVFTENGKVAQRFKQEDILVGNLGINIGLPAPTPPFPFAGMKNSFRGILHGQGVDPIQFFTQEKIIIERWL